MTDACCLNLKSTPEITIQVNFNSKHCELSEMRNFNLGAEYQISFLRFVFFHVCCFAGCACRLLTLSVHFTGLAPHAFGISVKGGTSTKIRQNCVWAQYNAMPLGYTCRQPRIVQEISIHIKFTFTHTMKQLSKAAARNYVRKMNAHLFMECIE